MHILPEQTVCACSSLCIVTADVETLGVLLADEEALRATLSTSINRHARWRVAPAIDFPRAICHSRFVTLRGNIEKLRLIFGKDVSVWDE
jgi:hypothetical protein